MGKQYKGLFVYCRPISKVNQSNEIYLGDWVSNKREGFGMYALVEEPMNNEEFEHCSMQLFLGDFVDNQMSHGVYLLKEGDDCYAYFGEFVNGKKQDNCALFYDNPKETVFRGKVANDQFESGIYTTFDEEDNINAFYYVEYEGGKATSYMKGQDLETSIVGKIKTQSEKFRHIMLDTDWFGNSYRLIKDIVKSIKGLNSIDNFNSKDALKIIDHILHKHEQLELYKILTEEAQ